jgi:membrane-bound serine protease (ClpP class)
LIIGALILPNEPLLFNPESEWFDGFLLTVIGIAAASAAFFLFAVGAVLVARRRKAKVGAEDLIGKITKVETKIDADGGTVKTRGEIWNARTLDGETINEGEKVVIVDREGLTLIVKRKE